jgi:hypothetical protein
MRTKPFLLLLKAFAKWGRPEQILSDNAKAFTSLLYTLTMATLSIGVRYSTPSKPWENPFAESMVGILRVYFYPRIQHQKSIAGVQKVVTEQTGYYNQRRHWEFRRDEVQTPLGKLGTTRGRPLPSDFELSVLAISKRSSRTVGGQGWISFKRYRLYVHCELSTQRVEIRECIDSLVVIYQSRPVVSYQCMGISLIELYEWVKSTPDCMGENYPSHVYLNLSWGWFCILRQSDVII